MPVLNPCFSLAATILRQRGQTIGFRRLPCHGQKPKKNGGLTGLTIRVCGEAALCYKTPESLPAAKIPKLMAEI